MLCKLLPALTKNHRSTAFGGKLCQVVVKSHNPPDCEKRVWPPFGAFFKSHNCGGYGLLWPPLVANGSAPPTSSPQACPLQIQHDCRRGVRGRSPRCGKFWISSPTKVKNPSKVHQQGAKWLGPCRSVKMVAKADHGWHGPCTWALLRFFITCFS